MKRFLTILLATLLLALPLGVHAAPDSTDDQVVTHYIPSENDPPASYWVITMRGRVLSNRGDALAVYLSSPHNMCIEEGDTAGALQQLPLTADTTAVDSAGDALAMDRVLSGQEVNVTFRFYYPDRHPRGMHQGCPGG